MRDADGHYRWVLARALAVRDAAGPIVKWLGTCTDIEDFKRVEADRQKFVSLVENSPDFIGMCDLDGVPFYGNPAALRMVGLDSIEAMRAHSDPETSSFRRTWPTSAGSSSPRCWRRATASTEVRFRHFKTGEARWMCYTLFTLADNNGQPVALATVSQDITERRQLEDDLRQLAADLSEADRRKDEFLATLAHELRNPLAPIRNGLADHAAGGSRRPGRRARPAR